MVHDASTQPAPLTGVRILDFTGVLAGPYCTYQLALLGAQVIKVERPGQGDFTRAGAEVRGVAGLTVGYVAQNADKRSVTIDLATPAGQALAHRLIAQSDVVIENFSPGVADRIGIGYEQVRAIRPDIVYASMSGYGQDGPWSARPAFDHVIQGMSGVTMLTGSPDTVPNRIGPPMIDYLSGIYGAFAVLAALMEHRRTGESQRIDLSMLDATVVAMASTTSAWLNAGQAPRPNGNIAASGSPASGIFQTRDGMLALAANNEHHVVRLCGALDPSDLLTDPRFSDPSVRATHATHFREALAQRLLQRSAAEWEDLLSSRKVPCARVRRIEDVLDEPHLAARGVQATLTDPLSGQPIAVPTIGFKWQGAAVGPRKVPSRLGADTEAVLTEAGLSPSDLAALRRDGIIG
jgi:crotonobetainyl-CoA:carnitine CoA-transferase CaiB-like acyl-CoA transferase